MKLFGLAMGILFGFIMNWTTFNRYDTIMDALLFRDYYLWAFFGTAVIAGNVGLRLLKVSGARTLTDGQKVEWTCPPFSRDHALGAVLFGIGWGICGACPGPVLAQIGSGNFAGIFTAAGIFAGIWLNDRLG